MAIKKYNRDEAISKILVAIAESYGMSYTNENVSRLVWFVNKYSPETSPEDLFNQAMDYSWNRKKITGITLNTNLISDILHWKNISYNAKCKASNLSDLEVYGYIVSLLSLNADYDDVNGLISHYENNNKYDKYKIIAIVKKYIISGDKFEHYGKRDLQYLTKIINKYIKDNTKINYSA